MRKSPYFVFALLCAYLCLPMWVNAQQNHFSIAPAPTWLSPYHPDLQKKPDSKEIEEGFYQLLSEEQTQVEKSSTYRHIIRQIESEAGIQNGSQLSVEYDPAYESLAFHEVMIRRDGQVINKLSASKFKFLQQEEDISSFIYSGTYTAHLILDDVRKGDQIEYAYTITGRNPIFEDKFFETMYLSTYEPIVNFYKCIITDSSRQLQFRAFNGAPMLKRSVHGRDAWYQYEGPVPLEHWVSDLPSWYTSYAFLQISEYKNWKEVVAWAMKINPVKAPGTLLQARIQSLKAAAGADRTLYMEKAIRFVQDDIRYIGIEMGENSHRANAPDKVLAQRFGDCKDKAMLLCTLLRANGISADMAYANTDVQNVLSTYLPSPYAFNHAIVHATLDGKSYWIDGTIAYQRGKLATLATPDYGLSLIANDTTTGLTAMHTRPRGEVTIKEDFTVPGDNKSDATLKVTSDYTHFFADDMRYEFATSSLKKQEENFLNFYRKIYGDASLKDSLTIKDNPLENHFQVVENYKISDPWKTDSTQPDKKIFGFSAKEVTNAMASVDDEHRKEPVQQKFPCKLHYTATLSMSQVWNFHDKEFHIKNAYYRFDFKPVVEGNLVTLYYDYETFTDNIPASYIPRYIKELDRIWNVNNFDITLDPVDFTGTRTNTDFSLNYMAVLAVLLFLFTFWRLARYYAIVHERPLPAFDTRPLDIGGLLIVLGIGIFVAPFIMFHTIVELPVFNFREILKAGTHTDGNASIAEVLLMGQLLMHLFFFVYALLLGYLFFNRREIFRITAIVFFAGLLLYAIIEVALAETVLKTVVSSEDAMQAMIWTALMALVFIPYLVVSKRVKATFLVPYE